MSSSSEREPPIQRSPTELPAIGPSIAVFRPSVERRQHGPNGTKLQQTAFDNASGWSGVFSNSVCMHRNESYLEVQNPRRPRWLIGLSYECSDLANHPRCVLSYTQDSMPLHLQPFPTTRRQRRLLTLIDVH